MNIQDLIEVIALGVKMRETQRAYFRTRSRDALTESLAREKEFDAKAAKIMGRYRESMSDTANQLSLLKK